MNFYNHFAEREPSPSEAVNISMNDNNKKESPAVDTGDTDVTVKVRSVTKIKVRKKPSVRDVVMYVLLAFFVAVFIYCAVIIVDYLIDVKREKDLHGGNTDNIGNILDDTSTDKAPVWTRPSPGSTTVGGNSTTTDTPSDPSGDVSSDTPSDSSAPDVSGTTSGSDTPVDSVTPDNTTTSVPSDNTTLPDDTTVVPDDTTTITDTDAVTTAPTEPEDESQYSEKFRQIRNELKALSAVAPDLYGYISIPTLGIKYPLVHRPEDTENMFYLTHAYDLSELKAGSIYADYRMHRRITDNKNLVIYGHNMRSGSMFGTLSKVVINEGIFNSTEVIIATMDGIYTYKVFSAYRTTSYDSYCTVNFADDDAFEDFIKGIVEKSVHKSDIGPITSADVILTLSTCTNITESGRYAVHAVLIKIEK